MAKQISFRVYRFEPGVDQAPRYVTYSVPAGEGFMVLDALQYVREHLDPSLRFRHSCHMGKCGSCAVTVNGKPGLACWELAVDGMTVEPLRGFPVVGDLVVERTEEDLQKAGLVFERKAPGPAKGCLEKLPQPYQKQYDEARTCIHCFSCVAACPYIYADENRELNKAMQYASRAYAIAPHEGAVNDTMGYVLLKNKKIEDAYALLKRAGELLPDNPTVFYHLALACNERGDKAQAKLNLQKALQMGQFPEEKKAQALLEKMKG